MFFALGERLRCASRSASTPLPRPEDPDPGRERGRDGRPPSPGVATRGSQARSPTPHPKLQERPQQKTEPQSRIGQV